MTTAKQSIYFIYHTCHIITGATGKTVVTFTYSSLSVTNTSVRTFSQKVIFIITRCFKSDTIRSFSSSGGTTIVWISPTNLLPYLTNRREQSQHLIYQHCFQRADSKTFYYFYALNQAFLHIRPRICCVNRLQPASYPCDIMSSSAGIILPLPYLPCLLSLVGNLFK